MLSLSKHGAEFFNGLLDLPRGVVLPRVGTMETVILAVSLLWAVIATLMYWRGIKQQNNLAHYVGLLLLDDKARRIHKENFEKYIHESSATDPQLLSTRAMWLSKTRQTASPRTAQLLSSTTWS